MNKSLIVIIIYVIGLIFGAIILGVWDAETSLGKASAVLIWTAVFLIALFYTDKDDQKKKLKSFFYYLFF